MFRIMTCIRRLVRPSSLFTRRSFPPTQTACRRLTSSSHHPYQHVLYFGNVLGYESVHALSKFPRAWLDSVGVSNDIDHGIRFTSASAAPHHLLLSYTLLDASLKRTHQSAEDVVLPGALHEAQEAKHGAVILDQSSHTATTSFPSKVFALGRNTHAQLGLGFSSQEATRGMVTGELYGSGGVHAVAAGNGFSLVVTNTEHGSNVFAFGNDTLGQLGSASCSPEIARQDAYDISVRMGASDAPQLKLLPLPKKVQVADADGWQVLSISAGLDHSLVLVESQINGWIIQSVLSTGSNTDGQLGLTTNDQQDQVPIQPLISRAFSQIPVPLRPVSTAKRGDQGQSLVEVVCGADTSYALTAGGDLWVWGNSEYGQSFSGVHDRIVAPLFVSNPLPSAYHQSHIEFDRHRPPKPRKLVAGGSFAAILDTLGRVWVAGYGPRGKRVSADPAEWASLSLVEFAPDCVVQDLFCGLEYLVAFTHTSGGAEVFIWGVPPRSISSVPIIAPTRVPFSLPRTPREQWLDDNPQHKAHQKSKLTAQEVRLSIDAAACTRDHLLLVINDGRHQHVWAECDQPPRDERTDVLQ